MEPETRFKWLFAAIPGFSAAMLFAILAWAVNKGFELSDESYYCLSATNPHSNTLLNSFFGLITHRFCPGVSDIRGLRICHLVYQLAATLFFAVSFLKFFSRWYPLSLSARVIIVFTLLIASGLNYDYLPITMSYNSWSLILSLVFFSCAMQSQVVAQGIKVLCYVVMGFCAVLLFYNKLPNGLAVSGLFTIHLLFFHRKGFWVWPLACFAGAVLGSLFLFGSVGVAINKTVTLVGNLKALSGSALGVYSSHLLDFVMIYPGLKLILAEFVLLVCLWVARHKSAPVWILNATTALNLLLIFFYCEGNSQHVSNDFVILFIILCAALGALVFLWSKVLLSSELIFIVAMFFLLPFLLALGTSNVIFYTASQLGIYSVATLLILGLAVREAGGHLVMPLICAALSLVVIPVICNGAVISPYRQQSLGEKTMPLVFSQNEEGLLESPSRYLMLADFTERLRFWNRENRPVLASPPVMGAIILAGMRPAEVYWWGDEERFADVNGYFFSKWRPAVKPFAILSEALKNSEVQLQHLKKSGIDINNGYVLCDSVFINQNGRFYFYRPL